MVDLGAIRDDLGAEHEDLDGIVADLDDARWDTPTPAEGWSVRDQIAHLAFFDEAATLAVTDEGAFAKGLEDAARDIEGFVEAPLERGRAAQPSEVLEWWRGARTKMLEAFANLKPGERVPWYGPAMSPASFMSARLMETWAHGQDIVDALGIDRDPTDRLRHVAHIGVRARANSYAALGREMPDEPVYVELRSPGGEVWSWGEPGPDAVRGDAVDFCLVVVQRRHPADTDLVIEGDVAREWMGIAQAFAGPPGSGRKPGQFPKRSSLSS